MVAALVLVGAPGTGKSSVLKALMTLLEIDGVNYGAIESEQLSMGSPLLRASDWTPQLEAVLALQRGADRQLFLIAATTESVDELRAVVSATHAGLVLVVCLSAPAEIVATRLADREPDRWPGKEQLIAHARGLAQSMPNLDGIDVVIDTEHRAAEDVAAQVHETMRAGRLLTARAGDVGSA
jgi:adenylate kinase